MNPDQRKGDSGREARSGQLGLLGLIEQLRTGWREGDPEVDSFIRHPEGIVGKAVPVRDGTTRPPYVRNVWADISHCRWWRRSLAAMACVALLVSSCSGDNNEDASSTKSKENAATAELGPLPPDSARAKAWIEANGEQVDRFRQVANGLISKVPPTDCTGVAERFNAALGPISDYLKLVAASPDPVLAELLTSAAISARTMVTACEASNTAVADDERSGLANALVLIERRKVELAGRQ